MSTVWIESRPQRLITLTQVYNPQVILDEIGKEKNLRYVFPVLWITLMSPSNSVFMHTLPFPATYYFGLKMLLAFIRYPSHLYCHSSLIVWSGENESCSVVSTCLWHHRLYSPWNSPGQNNGVGSLSLLQGIFPTQGLKLGLPHCRWILYHLSHQGKEKWSSSVVSDSLRPMDYSLPGSSVHGIFQARVLERGAIAFWQEIISQNIEIAHTTQ